jgi:hypothetical protein
VTGAGGGGFFEQMSVQVCGQALLAMAEKLADLRQRDASGQQERGGAVPERVNPLTTRW